MDDLLVLAPTRWKLRQAVKVVNQELAALGLEKPLDRTFIGRVEHGCDGLGYHICPGQVTVAPQTLAQIEREAIIQALQRSEGNRQAAARHLDIGPATLYRKFKECHIQ
jgi:DNA-binding NtrC family response regulator